MKNSNANHIRGVYPELSRTSQSEAGFSASFAEPKLDLICFSHLRWDFVYQRPQHLLSRCARERRVFFWEEPVFTEEARYELVVGERADGLWVLTPLLPNGLNQTEILERQREMLDTFLQEHEVFNYVAWYYTPMALGFTGHLSPAVVVYDCMDELAAFKGASPELKLREKELFTLADIVFTGGESLYEVKRTQHANVHAFPSSIELEHFAQARNPVQEPADQAGVPHPRMGFFGVLDERLDRELLEGIARSKPDWQFVMIGPVVKIDPAELPVLPNIHYLGAKQYKDLPSYIAHWDVALLLFAHNESTRFISPTKTPEYLAAGKAVVSTSIRDIVRPYGELGMVKVADAPSEFVRAVEDCLKPPAPGWRERVDAFLATNSWDKTWNRMWDLICEAHQSSSTAEVQEQQVWEKAASED